MNSTTVSRAAGRARRLRLLTLVGAVVCAVIVGGCGSEGNNASPASHSKAETVLPLPDLKGKEVVVTLLGGGAYLDALKKNVFGPFEKLTGARITVNTNCCDNFETAVKQGQFIGDLTMGNDYGPEQAWSEAGLLTADSRLAEIGKARGVDPTLYQKDLVAVYFYAYVLAWNTKYKDSHPANWSEFFDTNKFKETRGLFNLPFGDLEIAALADGATSDTVFPVDIDKSIAKVGQLRDGARINFWEGGADLINQLGSGEIAYSLGFSNRILQAKNDGLPVDMTTNQSLLVAGGAAIPKTAKNVDGAVALIDFYMSPKVQAAMATDAALAPAYPAAVELLPEELQKQQVTSEEALRSAILVDNGWWLKNTDTAVQAFNKFLAK